MTQKIRDFWVGAISEKILNPPKVELTKQTEAQKADVHYFSMGGKNRPTAVTQI